MSAGSLKSAAKPSLPRLMAWKSVEVAADLGVGEIEPAAEVAPVGALDLDHPRAEVAEPQGGERPRQELAHVEDEEPVEQAAAHACSLDEIGEGRGVAVFHGLQMLAVHDEFAFALEHLIARPDEPHLPVFRPLIEMGADRVDRVADEHGLDEAQFVVAVGKGVDAVRRHEPEAGGEHEGPGDEPLAENASRSRRTSGRRHRGACRGRAR